MSRLVQDHDILQKSFCLVLMDKKKHIILVEDEDTLANLIEAGLKKEGYEVEVARDGKEGLRSIEEGKPDLVLLDMMLPGLKGFDILEKLNEKGRLSTLPVVILSNSGEPIEIERALKMGVRDYLIKVNFSPEEVVVKVNDVLRAESERKKERKESAPKIVKGRRVLLVEDDTILSDVLQRKFTEKKYVVYKAVNVAMAKKVLAENEVDIILLDLVLPDEHGFSFLRELKKNKETKDIPVMIISNLGQTGEVEQGLREGAVDYIVKTDTVPGEIFEKVDTFLQKSNLNEKLSNK